MPSKRKRIGYLPSPSIQNIITKISNKEKLSQSKLVGILVEEALRSRGLFDINNTNDLITDKLNIKQNNINTLSFKYDDLDELISDKGITYNTKNHKLISKKISSESEEVNNEELFEYFKQFLLFKKMLKEK